MKIKSIAAICKKNKNIAIFERYSDDGDILTQYIGDGSAVYPVIGLPPLDAESLLTIFDVPEKDRDNYFVKTLGVPAGISFEDTDATERQVEREGISIIYSGRTLKPIRTTRGLVFIESRYLAPVADVLDVLELYERRTTDGAPEEKRLFTETHMKCPFCEGENSNARVYEDKQNKEYFVYCQKCGIETKDTFTSKAKAVKAFTEGKTKKITGSEVADE